MVADHNVTMFSLDARDRFGVLGLVGVLILRVVDKVGEVDTFLMSCRALGRRLENAMIEHCLANLAATHEIERWKAEYIPTAKNTQVADFWPRLGFAEIESDAGGKGYFCDAGGLVGDSTTFVKIEKD